MKVSDKPFERVTTLSHRQLEKAMQAAGLNDDLRNEVRILFRSYRMRGYFTVSTKRIEHTYGSALRKELKRFFDTCGFIDIARDYLVGRSSIIYVFNLSGCTKTTQPTDMVPTLVSGSFWDCPVIRLDRSVLWYTQINASFLEMRCSKWRSACEKFGWELNMDWDGKTPWGAGVVDSLRAVELPAVSDEVVENLAGGGKKGKWWRSYFGKVKNGVSPFVVRIRSRCYHALISCPRALREMLTVEFRGKTERLVGVDMSATYTSILAGTMPACDERERVRELLSNRGFYEVVNQSLPEGERFSDYKLLKQEFQRQCIFWKDWRVSSRPLWNAMRRLFPQLARFIVRLRRRLGASGLSDYLTKHEASLFIDNMLVRCHKNGIPCIPVHDAILVPESVAGDVKRSLEMFAKLAFGFVPGFKIA